MEPFLKACCNAGAAMLGLERWGLQCWELVMLRASLPHGAHLELEEGSCPAGLMAELRGTGDVV